MWRAGESSLPRVACSPPSFHPSGHVWVTESILMHIWGTGLPLGCVEVLLEVGRQWILVSPISVLPLLPSALVAKAVAEQDMDVPVAFSWLTCSSMGLCQW